MGWDYVREEQSRVEEGDHRVVIVDVQEKESKKGNEMIVITVTPNGSDIKINHYIVKNEYFNRNMTQFFDSFNIDEGDFNFPTWIGAVGAARLKEDDNGYLKVSWFLNKKKAEKLPEWIGEKPERQTITEIAAMSGFKEIPDDEVPFI